MPRKQEGAPQQQQPEGKTKRNRKESEPQGEGAIERLQNYLPKLKTNDHDARMNGNSVLAGELQACMNAINVTIGSIENFGENTIKNLDRLFTRLDAALAHDPKIKLDKSSIRF